MLARQHRHHTVTLSRKENVFSSSSSSSVSSSSSPFTPFHLDKPTRRRGVVFSATPLGSLNASPKHAVFFHPYYHSTQRRRVAVYSHQQDPMSCSSPPTSSPSTLTGSPGRVVDTLGRVVHGKNAGQSLLSLQLVPDSPASTSPLKLDYDDEMTTDDEAEEVEALLLSQEQIASSPVKLRSLANVFAAPTSVNSGLKSILKNSNGNQTMYRVSNAAEGSRRNGRRKHALNFDECRKAVPTTGLFEQVTLGKSVQSGGNSGAASAKGAAATAVSGGAAPAKRDVKGKGKEVARDGSGGDGAGGDDEPNKASTPSASSNRTHYAVLDDDPILLRTPLLTLHASLRPLSDGFIRQRQAQSATADVAPPFLPRASTSTLPPPSSVASPSTPLARSTSVPPRPAYLDEEALEPESDDDREDAFDLPPTLVEVEDAYALLTRALVRLPSPLLSASNTLSPLRQYRTTLRRCLERDISNISSFPAWSSERAQAPTSSPSSTASEELAAAVAAVSPSEKSKKKGKGTSPPKMSLSQDEMRRLRDEIGAAQAAIKCFAAIASNAETLAVFDGTF